MEGRRRKVACARFINNRGVHLDSSVLDLRFDRLFPVGNIEGGYRGGGHMGVVLGQTLALREDPLGTSPRHDGTMENKTT